MAIVGALAGVTGLTLLAMTGATSSGAVAPRTMRAVFLRDCAVCHSADGAGTERGPNLSDAGRAGVDYWVSTGRMPLSSPDATPERHTPRYSPSEIHRLVDYVVMLTGNSKPEIPHVDTTHPDLAAGARQYQLNCAACHAATGVGGALFRRAAPPVTPASSTEAAEAIRIGPGQMPAFGRAALSDRQLSDTVGYVRSLAHPRNRGGYSLWEIGPLAEGGAVVLLGLLPLVLITRWIGSRE
jgi:ubiquinol-cytochrome c reductase cytochrome c subunit